VGTILSVLLFGSVRPSFWLAALGSLLPVCLVFLRRGWFREKVAIFLGAIAGLTLLVLPERLLAYHDDVDRVFVPMLLFSQHADIIRDQMAADLAASAQLPYAREWLVRIHSVLRSEIQKSFEANPEHYPSLGFDPEYLMYRANFTATSTNCAPFTASITVVLCSSNRCACWERSVARWRSSTGSSAGLTTVQSICSYEPIMTPARTR
jgi:hypothetical protein